MLNDKKKTRIQREANFRSLQMLLFRDMLSWKINKGGVGGPK